MTGDRHECFRPAARGFAEARRLSPRKDDRFH
jgi:hypothetical protein